MMRAFSPSLVVATILTATVATWADPPINSAELIYGQRIAAAKASADTDDDQALVDQMARAAAKTDDLDLQDDLAEIICTWAIEKDLSIEPSIAPRLWLQLGDPDTDAVIALLDMLPDAPADPDLAPERLAFVQLAASRLEAAGLWGESLSYLDAADALLTDDMDEEIKARYYDRLKATRNVREQMAEVTRVPTAAGRLALALHLAQQYPDQVGDWLDDSLPADTLASLELLAKVPNDRTPMDNYAVARWAIDLARDGDTPQLDDLLLETARQCIADALAGCDPDGELSAALAESDARAVQQLLAAGVEDIPAIVAPRVRPTWLQMRVHADRTWQDALGIVAGDEVVIVARGKWHTYWGAGRDHIAGPRGHGDTAANRYGQLLGRIGVDGQPFDVMEGITFTAEADGMLQLGCNDERRNDNAGYMTVTIQITPASE